MDPGPAGTWEIPKYNPWPKYHQIRVEIKTQLHGDPTNTPPSDNPFGELDNVVMSPHRGGWLHEVETHRVDVVDGY